MNLSRRSFILTGLATPLSKPGLAAQLTKPAIAATPAKANWVIGTIPDKPFDIDLVNMELVPEEFRRQVVPFTGPEPAGSIVIDAAERHLYFVLMNGTAIRFGVAVGKQGAVWHGKAIVGRKAKWPSWTPTSHMRKKNPKLPVRQDGGPKNPLGARALYLFKDGIDTLYRIHGTNDPSSIGKSVSSGCIRMFNENVFELFAEVQVGTPVTVR